MTTFGLIHGGFHTSWCWGTLRAELERRSHRVLTVDLPVSDPAADPDAYLDVVASAFGSAPDPVVVVGHSIAGWTAMRLPNRIPVAGIIYLCSCINLPPGEYEDEPLPMISADPADWTPDDTGLITMTPDAAREYFYHDLDPALADEAISHLVRQAAIGVAGPTSKPTIPPVPATYIKATDDRAVSDAWATWAARLLTGRDALPIGGSHSPFLSRPRELADLFEQIVGRY